MNLGEHICCFVFVLLLIKVKKLKSSYGKNIYMSRRIMVQREY